MSGTSTLMVALAAALAFGSLIAAEPVEPPTSQLADLLGSDADPAFARALAPRAFAFPQDHGPHPEFRNEWWYVTGNLDDEDGQRFGFELTIFRFALAPTAPVSSSAWRTNQVYIAHLAVTDAGNEEFHVAQRYARGAVGLAGAQATPFRVWIDDWEMTGQADTGTWRLRANDTDVGVDLELTALKPPVLNGIDGLSQKSSLPGNASYYYSITRLATNGSVRISEREFQVSGLSWLDREWSTSALADDQVGWDWFALQLSDGADLMFYNLRKQDGAQDAARGGTLTRADGTVRHRGPGDVMIDVLDTWGSPDGGSYPSRWRLSLTDGSLDVEVTPVIANQELFTTVRYWEGAVEVSGRQRGRGDLELSGYHEPAPQPDL